jgi:hypothetical protein
MAGTDDISFIELDDDTLAKLRKIAREKLSPQQGSLVVVFAAVASQEAEVPARTDVDELLAQLRQAYTGGQLVPPIRFCIVPAKPPPGPGDGEGDGGEGDGGDGEDGEGDGGSDNQ